MLACFALRLIPRIVRAATTADPATRLAGKTALAPSADRFLPRILPPAFLAEPDTATNHDLSSVTLGLQPRH
jgi:hypothetical protein